MPAASLTHVLHHLRTLSEAQATRDLSDGELLERFRVHREETAFALLVQRHGPMVLGVCRRLLGDAHAAEDAFQATFLILVRKATSIRKRASVASWLYGVARRVAVKARLKTTRDHVLERQSFAMQHSEGSDQWTSHELRQVLDEELDQLPEKYRLPLILCGLQGKTHHQAAREMGCPRRSLSSRLGRARELLRARLTRRGFAVSAAALAAVLSEKATAAVPALLTIATVRTVMQKTSEAISANVAALTEEGIKAMSASKAKAGLALVVMIAALTTLGHQLMATDEPAPEDAKPPVAKPVAEDSKSRKDLHGDPLPEGAVMRLGTLERRAVGAKLAMSADGKSIIGVRGGKYIHVWDADTGKLREKRELAVDDQWRRFWLSDDGRLLATGRDNGVAIWDLRTGKRTLQLPIKRQGFVDRVVFSAAPCPCGSGKKYKHCCCGKRFDYEEDAEGRIFKSIPMSDEMMGLLEGQRQKFIQKYGREPGPGDKVFFDMPHPEQVEHMTVQAMKAAGIDPAIIHAYEKTGRLALAPPHSALS